jgi:hypothetical protein
MRISIGLFRKVSKDENIGFCGKGRDFFYSPHILNLRHQINHTFLEYLEKIQRFMSV